MIGLTMRSVTWNRFPIKNLWLIPCFFHLWSEVTWIEMCTSLNHRKKIEAEPSWLIPLKPIKNEELFIVSSFMIMSYCCHLLTNLCLLHSLQIDRIFCSRLSYNGVGCLPSRIVYNIFRPTEQQTNFRSHAWLITSTENPFPERTIARLVFSLSKFTGTHCTSAPIHNCHDAFPSPAIAQYL